MATHPFQVKNCAISAVATGEYAGSLLDFRNKIATINEMCLYYHFWGMRLHLNAIERQHHNDFASWVFHRLHDAVLAERLSVVDPTEFPDLAMLQQEILNIIDERLDDYHFFLWTGREDLFRFIRAILIIYESDVSIPAPENLLNEIKKMSDGGIFYHFIDARVRTEEKKDDFSLWIKTFGNDYEPLVQKLQAIDPYFFPLKKLKSEILITINDFFDERGISNV